MARLKEVSELPPRKGKAGTAAPLIEEFVESKMKLAQVDRSEWKAQPMSIVTSLRAYLKNNEINNIKVIMRSGEVFLQKTK